MTAASLAALLALSPAPPPRPPAVVAVMVDAIPGDGRADRIARLSSLLCSLQPRLRWKRGRLWDEAICREAATSYVFETTSDEATPIHDLLVLAVSIQESDLVDNALSKDQHDHGLMGVRWPSRFTHGVKEKDLKKIAVNIRIGVAELRYWKTAPLVDSEIRHYRDKNGRRTAKYVTRPCDHERAHAFFLHYNNGNYRSKDDFKARYDRRVGAIYAALCARFGEEPVEMRSVPPDGHDTRTRGIVDVIRSMPWADPAAPSTLADVAPPTFH